MVEDDLNCKVSSITLQKKKAYLGSRLYLIRKRERYYDRTSSHEVTEKVSVCPAVAMRPQDSKKELM
jgi:hypothetical protein